MSAPTVRRRLAAAGNVVLWVTAALGTVSLLLALATVVAGVQPLIFRSGSMGPDIPAGSLGLARTVDATDVAVGDVVSVANSDGVRVTHRVVEAEPTGSGSVSLTLKGDTNPEPDPQPYVADEVDRVFLDVPWLGRVAAWMSSPWAMFLSGLVVAGVVASLWRRGDGGGGSTAGRGLAAVAVLGLAAASVRPVPGTEAYFTDQATFEAGTIQAHQVRIFDWGSPVCTDNADGSITVRTLVASPRYHQVWYASRSGVAPPATPFLRVTPPGAANSAVDTRITRAMLQIGATDTGLYRLTGRSELKGSATTPWLSASTRSADITVTDSATVRCGNVNLAPTIVFTSPKDGVTYLSTDAVDSIVASQCGLRRSPCGTATDSDGIRSVEYRLQRSNLLGTQCWNPDALFGPGYYLTSCGTFRPATTSPAAPNTSTQPVTWQVPLGSAGPGTAFNLSGEYTLYLRVTDNSAERIVTERTIRFTVR